MNSSRCIYECIYIDIYVYMLIKYMCGDDNKKVRGCEFGKGAAEGTGGKKRMGMIRIQNSPRKLNHNN